MVLLWQRWWPKLMMTEEEKRLSCVSNFSWDQESGGEAVNCSEFFTIITELLHWLVIHKVLTISRCIITVNIFVVELEIFQFICTKHTTSRNYRFFETQINKVYNFTFALLITIWQWLTRDSNPSIRKKIIICTWNSDFSVICGGNNVAL